MQYCQNELPEEGVIEFQQKSLFKGGQVARLSIQWTCKTIIFASRSKWSAVQWRLTACAFDAREPQNATKLYRHMNRCTFQNAAFPVKVDLTIVKTGRQHRSFKSLSVLDTAPSYEIEIEVDNEQIEPHRIVRRTNSWQCYARSSRLFVRAANDHYPVSYPEQEGSLQTT